MSVTLYSFAMAVVLSTLFVFFTHLFRRKEFLLRSFGIPALLFLYGLCVFRIAFPLEFPFTKPIEITQDLQSFVHSIRLETIDFGGVSMSPLHIALWTWLAGALAAAFFFSYRYLRSIRKVKTLKGLLPVDSVIEKVFAEVQREAAHRIPAELCICPGLDIPFGIGVFQKRILLSDKEYSESEFFYILKHEYTHFCNHDLVVKMLVNLFCCVFWWNPFVYLLQNDITEILELKCDRVCTAGFSKMQKVGYLSILEKIVEETPEEDDTPLEKRKGRLLSKTGASFFMQKNNSFTKERFRLVQKPIVKGNLLGQIVVLSIFTALFMASYTVVVQPRFDPSVEDIYTDGSVHEISAKERYIYMDKTRNYFFVLENGKILPVKKETVEVFTSEGIRGTVKQK